MKMERYTKKVKNSYCEYLPKDPEFLDLIGANKNNLENTYDCELSCLVDKLGRLEDLMKKYHIDSLDELEERLQRPAVYTFSSEKEYKQFKKTFFRNDRTLNKRL